MKVLAILIFSLVILAGGAWRAFSAEPEFFMVYEYGEGSYPVIRTPQLLVTKVGTFLVFAQGRSSSHDRSDNDIILKRSEDGGNTWSNLRVIANEGKDSLNAICVVQLRDSGRILVVGCRFPDGYAMQEIQYLSAGLQEYHKKTGHDQDPAIKPGFEGPGIARNYVIESDDDGRTWSGPRDITREAKRPGVRPPDGYQADGENMLPAWLGEDVQRTKPLFWDWRGKDTPKDCWPRWAIRDGDWKLLGDDGKRVEPYHTPDDWGESANVAKDHPTIVEKLLAELAAWKASLPKEPSPDCLSKTGRRGKASRPAKGASSDM